MKSNLPSALLATVLLLGCRSQQLSPGVAASLHPFAGTYYRGDGLGYNVTVNLKPDARYTAQWRGCLGVYGTARGTWALDGQRIVFSPSKETDMMRGHLRELHIVRQDGQIVFVPDLTDSYYRQYGPNRYSAFERQDEKR